MFKKGSALFYAGHSPNGENYPALKLKLGSPKSCWMYSYFSCVEIRQRWKIHQNWLCSTWTAPKVNVKMDRWILCKLMRTKQSYYTFCTSLHSDTDTTFHGVHVFNKNPTKSIKQTLHWLAQTHCKKEKEEKNYLKIITPDKWHLTRVSKCQRHTGVYPCNISLTLHTNLRFVYANWKIHVFSFYISICCHLFITLRCTLGVFSAISLIVETEMFTAHKQQYLEYLLTPNTWHMIHDTWHVTCDTWWGWKFSQNLSSPAFTVWV